MSETRTTEPRKGASGGDRRLNWFARIGLFVRQVISELRKVVWPTRSQLITYTTVSIVFIVGMMVIVGVLDLISSQIVLWLFGNR